MIITMNPAGETIISHESWHKLSTMKDDYHQRSEDLLGRANTENDETRAQEWKDLSDHYAHLSTQSRKTMDDVLAITPDHPDAEENDEIELLKITAAANARDRTAREADQAREDVQFAARSARTLIHGVSAYQIAKRARASQTAVATWLG